MLLIIFGAIFGLISISAGVILFIAVGRSYPVTIVATIILLIGGTLAILPLRFYKKYFVREISYLFAPALIITFLSYILFFEVRPSFFGLRLGSGFSFSGDWSMIPLSVYASLLFGSLCIPILIIKSIKSKKE